MKVTGGCHCGHITYEAEVDPATVRVCHCTDCQKLTGTAFRTNVASLPGTFRLMSGSPKIYIKTAESGNKRAHGFCPECGTPAASNSPMMGRTPALCSTTWAIGTSSTPSDTLSWPQTASRAFGRTEGWRSAGPALRKSAAAVSLSLRPLHTA